MREIKFRLRISNVIVGYEKWDEDYRVWHYSKDNKNWTSTYIYHTAKDEFTGLKDKNKVEIYEGDILTHISVINNRKNGSPKDDFSDDTSIPGVTMNKNKFPIHRNFEDNPYRVVEYLTGNEQCREKACYYPLFSNNYDAKDFVIIGNIYENPELLK